MAHLFAYCRFTKRFWEMIKDWHGMASINVNAWSADISISSWWTSMPGSIYPNNKAMATLTLLTCWTIWNE
jgi:hypothetical protein